MSEPVTYNETRFVCRCGRFLSESAIRSTDHRDDSRYYGIRSEVEWDCSRCGTVKGDEWEPSLVTVATRTLPDARPETAPPVPTRDAPVGESEGINA